MNWKTTATAMGLALLASTSLARAEGELNIYNWGNYTSPDVIKKFEEKYNIKVTITDYDSNDTALAKVRQGGTGFDIAVPSQTYVPIWIKEGLVLETDPGKMENFKNVGAGMGQSRFRSRPQIFGAVGMGHRSASSSIPMPTRATSTPGASSSIRRTSSKARSTSFLK